MAAQVIANAAQMRIQWSGVNGTWENVLGLTGNPTLPAINQALADNLHALVSAQLTASAMMTHMPSTTIFERVVLRSLAAPNLPEFTSAGTPLAGGGTDDQLPLSNAVCVTLRTAFAGKSFRGRVYFSGWGENSNTAAGRVLGAANSSANTFMNALRTTLPSSNLNLAVLSRPADAVTIPAVNRPARPGQANSVISTLVRDDKWESQRRRTGRN